MAETKTAVYFANLPVGEIEDAILSRKDDYYQYLMETGRTALLRNVYDTYHRPALHEGRLRRAGEQGEFVKLTVNDFRNLVQHRISMTTTQRIHFEPKAINTDYKSQAQVTLSRGLLEYYNRIKHMETHTGQAVEYAVAYGEGFLFAGWNPTKGDKLTADPETGEQVNEGDLEFESFSTFDAIRPVENSNNEEMDWVTIRRFKNKYDQAAKYPELADKILDLDLNEEHGVRTDFVDRWEHGKENSLIPVYTFLHRRSEAVPEGRIVEFSESGVTYHEGPLPYRSLPIKRIAPSEQKGKIYGYTAAFDLLPIQAALDKLDSTILTNQAAFGVQNVAIPKGSGVNVLDIGGALNIVEYDAKWGPPTTLQLLATPPEIFTYREMLKKDAETIIGINSVTRGDPQDSLKSGAALALVQSMAIQFAQGLQLSYIQFLEDIATTVIEILQDFATVERVALITGRNTRSMLKEFKNEDIENISRVVVDVGNPLNQTVAGRVNLAEQLLNNQMIETPQQFIEVITSGRFEPVIESEHAELMLVRNENEALQEGTQPPVIRTDNHELHIKEHRVVLASPESRTEMPVVKATLAHIQEHETMLAPPPLPGTEVDSNAEQDQAQLAESEQGNIPGQLDPTAPVLQEAGGQALPNLPNNPLTGEPNEQ